MMMIVAFASDCLDSQSVGLSTSIMLNEMLSKI